MKQKIEQPYVCIACGYNTDSKGAMRRHFGIGNDRKKPCPKIANDIELTPEIKEYILANRIYRIPAPPPPATTINYNTQINNYVNGIDACQQLAHLMTHNDQTLIDLEDKVIAMHAKQIESYTTKTHTPQTLAILTLVEAVDKICKVQNKDCSDYSIMYDELLDGVKILEAGVWEEMSRDRGVQRMIEIIKSSLWDHYEAALLRSIQNEKDLRARQILGDDLIEYFKFLAAFDLKPRCCGEYKDKDDVKDDASNDEVVFDEDYLPGILTKTCKTFATKFFMLRTSPDHKPLTSSEIKDIRSKVRKALERNTVVNTKILKQLLKDSLKRNKEFRCSLLAAA